jgi:hypothetical protein
MAAAAARGTRSAVRATHLWDVPRSKADDEVLRAPGHTLEGLKQRRAAHGVKHAVHACAHARQAAGEHATA